MLKVYTNCMVTPLNTQIEPIDYRLHNDYYHHDENKLYYNKSDIASPPPPADFSIEEEEREEVFLQKSPRDEAIRDIALFIFASILFVAAAGLLITGVVSLITASIPLLPFLIPGLLSAGISGLIFYNLFKRPE